jgi:hypothetical protein
VMGMGHQMQAMQSTAKMASSMATATKVKDLSFQGLKFVVSRYPQDTKIWFWISIVPITKL